MYGGIDIGSTPGPRSTKNSNFLCGGNPSIYSRKTSIYSLTTGVLFVLPLSQHLNELTLYNIVVLLSTHSILVVHTLHSTFWA